MINTSIFECRAVETMVDVEHFRCSTALARLDFLVEPRLVARRAEALIRRLKEQQRSDLSIGPRDIVMVTYAGLLIYAMERYGYDYTHICRLTSKEIADILACISSDPRLDLPLQRNQQISRLREAPVMAQLVRLAELSVLAQQLVDVSESDWLKARTCWGNSNGEELSAWTDYAYNSLSAMDAKLFLKEQLKESREAVKQRLLLLYARGRTRKLSRAARMAQAAASVSCPQSVKELSS